MPTMQTPWIPEPGGLWRSHQRQLISAKNADHQILAHPGTASRTSRNPVTGGLCSAACGGRPEGCPRNPTPEVWCVPSRCPWKTGSLDWPITAPPLGNPFRLMSLATCLPLWHQKWHFVVPRGSPGTGVVRPRSCQECLAGVVLAQAGSCSSERGRFDLRARSRSFWTSFLEGPWPAWPFLAFTPAFWFPASQPTTHLPFPHLHSQAG